jgi:hypothetical protein
MPDAKSLFAQLMHRDAAVRAAARERLAAASPARWRREGGGGRAQGERAHRAEGWRRRSARFASTGGDLEAAAARHQRRSASGAASPGASAATAFAPGATEARSESGLRRRRSSISGPGIAARSARSSSRPACGRAHATAAGTGPPRRRAAKVLTTPVAAPASAVATSRASSGAAATQATSVHERIAPLH